MAYAILEIALSADGYVAGPHDEQDWLFCLYPFAYQSHGTEHRFWKVLRELGFTDLLGNDTKAKFLNFAFIQ